MRPAIIWGIFRKELIETLRDRRTLLMMVGLPVLLYPMMIIGVGWFQRSDTEKRQERPSIVAVWGEDAPEVTDWLRKAGKLTLKRWAGAAAETQALLRDPQARPAPIVRGTDVRAASPQRASNAITEVENPVLAAARAAVGQHTADAVVIAWPGFGRALADGGAGSITVYYDSVQPDSLLARDRLVEALRSYRLDLIEVRERTRSLTKGFALGIDILQRNVASEQRRSGEMLGMLLPFALIVMSLLGALYPAIDLTAGEKERGTMQTLMCAPVTPHEIIVGKFLTVWTISLIAALANVISLAATITRMLSGTLRLPITAYAATFGMLVPVTLIISALFLAVAAFARDFKDGQNFLTPLYMVLAMPAVATMLPGVQLTASTAFVPVVNIALLIKSVMLAEAAPDLVFLALVSSLTYAGLALALAARVFQQEQLLLGGHESLVQLLGLERRPGRTVGPGVAIVAFAIVLVVVFYGSLLLRQAGIVTVLLVTEYGFFLLPTLAIVFWLGFPARRTLALRRPPLRALIGSILIGLSAWTFAGGVLIRLLPPPDSLSRALQRILLLDGKTAPLWVVWLVIGLTPALCEELFFRGLVLSGLRRLGILPAVLVSALLFGLAHASIYRLLPTAFLGVLFGYAVWRTGSIACSITAHTLNNGLIATIVYAPAQLGWLVGGKAKFVPWPTTIAGCVLIIAGALLIASTPQFERARSAPERERV